MHILNRINEPQDPWQRMVLLSLKQLAEDMRVNEKRVSAFEAALAELHKAFGSLAAQEHQDLLQATKALEDLHQDIRDWSKQSLARAEDLAVAVRVVASEQDQGDVETARERLAG